MPDGVSVCEATHAHAGFRRTYKKADGGGEPARHAFGGMEVNLKKDIDFLYSAARVRALETKMLNRERASRLIDARTDSEAQKLLGECAFTIDTQTEPDSQSADGGTITAEQVEIAIRESLADAFNLCESISPDKDVVKFFRVKYDYHNLKTLLKAEATGNYNDAEPLLSILGRASASKLRDQMLRGGSESMSKTASEAVAQARDVLARTKDARAADIIMDKAMYTEMTNIAKESGSAFEGKYVELLIDSVNLRTCMRIIRMNGTRTLLENAIIEGGQVSKATILRQGEISAKGTAEIFQFTSLGKAAEEGARAVQNGVLFTAFEKEVNNAAANFLKSAALVPFGAEPVIAYLANKELEASAVRTIMLGRMAGLKPEVIRERLCEKFEK